MYEIRRYTTALGRGKFIPGWIVIRDEKLVEWFRTETEAIRYVERKKEELTRDG
jgi:hypothetical protein